MLKQRFTRPLVVALTMLASVGLSTANAEDSISDPAARVSFTIDVRPILATHCTGCHGGVKQAGGLSFAYEELVLGECDSGVPIVVPKSPDESYLMERVTDSDPDYRMPPGDHGPALNEQEISTLRRWIEQGAQWEEPWVLVPPVPHEPPNVEEEEWCRTTVDHFVLARLEQQNMKHAKEASRAQWLRRVSFDLTGLPPSLQEIADFEHDNQPGAHERVVDRLLSSTRYGERWASLWLDLSRYADTMGYEKDPARAAWPYRDWLIRALNQDLPYDEFLTKQLAGDLLDDVGIEDKIATGFNRNTQTNTEGGTDDEEFRVAAVIDRVNTTWQVFGGVTFGCVQCHSHPYDPFRHEDYYSCLAYFNNSHDADLENDFPRLKVPVDPTQYDRAEKLDAEIKSAEQTLHDQFMPRAADLGSWRYLAANSAESTGSATMSIRESEDGISEVWATGTISVGSTFTFEYQLPATMQAMSALRIEALPQDMLQAMHIPEFGFVLTRLKAWLVPAEGEPIEVTFRRALSDDPHPQMKPQDSLADNSTGWSQFTRMSRPSFAIFVLDEPIEVPADSVLRLTLEHKRNANGTTAMAIRRARVAATASAEWNRWLQSPSFVDAVQALQELRKKRAAIKSVNMPVMEELREAESRKTFQFVRGNWLDHADEQTPATPAALPSLSEDAPENRLGLAMWFTSRDNPLTARVAVNRIWAQLFGIGIVETVEDMGTSGTLPSHPKLLDHLACRLRDEHDWSLKALLREIVLSATYRQSADGNPELWQQDPRNRLLARGPRNRLTAEMVRDQALAVSGLLSDKMYGPPVMPPQPEGIWKSVYNGANWKTAKGEDRYRRAVYTFWKRTSAYPSMLTFDAPSREVCSSRRIATNTPLQALVTLNDAVYVECGEALARRMRSESGESIRDQLAFGYQLTTSTKPTQADLLDLAELYASAATEFASTQQLDAENKRQQVEQAALSAVASALLNTDRALNK